MARRGGRPSHLAANTAAEGMERYMEVCGSSGLPAMQKIARRYKRVPAAERLDFYINDVEAKVAEGKWDAPSWLGDNPDDLGDEDGSEGTITLRDGTVVELDEVAEALGLSHGGGNMPARTRTRQPAASRRRASRSARSNEGFIVGTVFSYENGSGEVNEHEIERVAGNKAFTTEGKSFKVSTLEKLLGSKVEILES